MEASEILQKLSNVRVAIPRFLTGPSPAVKLREIEATMKVSWNGL